MSRRMSDAARRVMVSPEVQARITAVIEAAAEHTAAPDIRTRIEGIVETVIVEAAALEEREDEDADYAAALELADDEGYAGDAAVLYAKEYAAHYRYIEHKGYSEEERHLVAEDVAREACEAAGFRPHAEGDADDECGALGACDVPEAERHLYIPIEEVIYD